MGVIEKVADKPVGKFSIGRAFGIGAAKATTEALLAPVIGNGTMGSGLLKVAGAWGVDAVAGDVKKYHIGTVAQYTASGMAVDGVEDIINAVSKWISGSPMIQPQAQSDLI